MKHQAAYALSEQRTTGVDNYEIKHGVPVIVMAQTKSYNEKKFVVPDRTKKKKMTIHNSQEGDLELPTLSEFIIA